MSISEKRKIGNLGENLAYRFLVKHGFSIVDRNYSRKWGELDIIAKKGLKTHFIEVKSVSCENILEIGRGEDAFRPEDNLHPWKLQRLGRIIQTYLLEKDVSPETDWQFDVITVYIDKNSLKAKVFMLENVIL